MALWFSRTVKNEPVLRKTDRLLEKFLSLKKKPESIFGCPHKFGIYEKRLDIDVTFEEGAIRGNNERQIKIRVSFSIISST
jgi:hypothetical protein